MVTNDIVVLNRNKYWLKKVKQSQLDVYKVHIRNAESRGLITDLTLEEYTHLSQQNCSYCGIEPYNTFKGRGIEYHYNGIDRIDNTKGYIKGNIAPCCGPCNIIKKDKSVVNFDKWLKHNNIKMDREGYNEEENDTITIDVDLNMYFSSPNEGLLFMHSLKEKEHLTKTEKKIVRYLGTDHSRKEISQLLNMTRGSVRSHIRNIKKKMQK